MTDFVNASILIIQTIIEIHGQIQFNKKQCSRLIERLSTVSPMLTDWKRNHADTTKTSYHHKTFEKFYHFLQEVEVFIRKFTDRNYLTKVFTRNVDSEMFLDINTDLSNYIRDLQLGILFDVKQCQEEDQSDRLQDMSDLRQAITAMTNNNQAMMDLMMNNMQQMMNQMMERVDQAIASNSGSLSSSIGNSSFGMTDSELSSIESKIEAMSASDSIASTSSTLTSSKKVGISLDDLRMIDHIDVKYSTDSSSGSFIGGGTFGDVFKGTYKGKPVAIKVLKDNTAMAMSALKKEAYAMQLLSACNHMIHFYGVRIDSKPFYLVMELASCSLYDMLYDENCSNKLIRHNPSDKSSDWLMNKLKVLYDIIQGIYFLHTVKVIHRDIKPMNVMLSQCCFDGKIESIMKLSDFGSAKMKDVGASTNGLAKGTPAYMAPEIILADDPDTIEYTEATDIYAFGILMNEVLEHIKPFDGMKGIQIIRALDKGSRPKLFRSEEDLTATGDGFIFELQLLIDRCWHDTVTKRPAALSVAKKLARLGGFKAVAVVANHLAASSMSANATPVSSPVKPSPASVSTTGTTMMSPSAKSAETNARPSPLVQSNPQSLTGTTVTATVNIPPKAAPSAALPPPVPPKPTKPAAPSMTPVGPVAAPPVPPKPPVPTTPTLAELKAKELNEMLGHYEEAFRYFTEVRMLYNFDKVPAMKRLALAKISKQSGFVAGFALVCLTTMEAKAALRFTDTEILSLGRFVLDEMNLILSTEHLKAHPKLSYVANYFLGIINELGYYSPNCASKDLNKAFAHMTLSAEAGFPPAESSLGLMYDRGTGTRANLVEAFKWFRRSADANYLPGLHNTGHCLERGDGCTKNPLEASRYYQRAVDAGYVPSMVNLGLMYRDGRGVTKNPVKAYQLFQQGSLKGCACGQMHLGVCYQDGVGVAKNPSEAFRWFQQSANQGDSAGIEYLGICYEYGWGVAKNVQRARELYKESSDAGNEDATFVLKELTLHDKAFRLFHRIRYEYIFSDYPTLKGLFRNEGNLYAAMLHLNLLSSIDAGVKNHLDLSNAAAEARDILKDSLSHFTERSQFSHPTVSSYAHYALGLIYEYGLGGQPKDVNKAFNDHYLVSAQKGYALAQNSVGFCYCAGTGCAVSDANSIPWFQKAADQGFSQAMHNLGYSYQYGSGVAQNFSKALEYYRAAMDLGHTGSTLNYGVMLEEGYGVAKDKVRAASLYRIAADKGEPQAQYNMGVCYEHGTGVTKDKNQAKRYYQLAAAQNHADAKSRLEKCVIS